MNDHLFIHQNYTFYLLQVGNNKIFGSQRIGGSNPQFMELDNHNNYLTKYP